MRFRGILTAFSAMLLLAGMFVAVHRGAEGRGLVEQIGAMSDRQAAADVRERDLLQEIEHLRSRGHVIREGERLGLHLPSEDELVILDLPPQSAPGGSL